MYVVFVIYDRNLQGFLGQNGIYEKKLERQLNEIGFLKLNNWVIRLQLYVFRICIYNFCNSAFILSYALEISNLIPFSYMTIKQT